jgi:hypothetical protein
MTGLFPKTTKCSMFQQISHEFHCVAREHIGKGTKESELRKSIHALIEKQSSKCAKSGIAMLILGAMVSNLSEGGVVRIDTPFADLSLPKVYLVFAGSFAWTALLLSSLKIVQLVTFQVKIRFFSRHPGRFLAADAAIMGAETADLISPLRVGHHFRLASSNLAALGFFFSALFLIGLLPVFGCVSLFIASSLSQFGTDYGFFLEDTAAFCSIALIISPILYIILFFIPVSIKESQNGIYASKFYRSRIRKTLNR